MAGIKWGSQQQESVLGEAPGDAALVALPSGDDAWQGISGFDFGSIDVPEVSLLDFGGLAGELSGEAGMVTAESVGQSLGLAQGAADRNREALQNAFDTAIGQTVAGHATLTDAVLRANMGVLDAVNPAWRGLLDTATGVATEASAGIATYLAANLPTMLQQGANIASKQGEIVQSLLSGKIPDDVADQIKRRAAESAGSRGLFGSEVGGAGRAMEARDLGLSSLQMQTLGAAMAGDSAALWSNAATAAASIAASAQAPIDTLFKMQDELGLKPEIDALAMFDKTYSENAKATTIDPTQVFSSSLSQYNSVFGWGLDVAKGNQQAQTQYDSMMLQFESDKMNASVAIRNAELAAKSQLRAAEIDAATTQNSATINANAVTKAAWYNASASIEGANATARGNVEAAIGAASINKGVWDNTRTGTERVRVERHGLFDNRPEWEDKPRYEYVFKPAR